MVSHYYELASRYNELVSRYYELASRYNEVVARYYDLVSPYYELVSRYNELVSRYFEDFFFFFFFKCPYRLSYVRTEIAIISGCVRVNTSTPQKFDFSRALQHRNDKVSFFCCCLALLLL